MDGAFPGLGFVLQLGLNCDGWDSIYPSMYLAKRLFLCVKMHIRMTMRREGRAGEDCDFVEGVKISRERKGGGESIYC